MKWVTRAHVNIDRVSCPWLIKRFIDTDAEFYFVAKEHVLQVADSEKAIPFDIPGVDLGHHGDSCTFLAFLDEYHIQDPALNQLGELINATTLDNIKAHPFVSCMNAISQGFSLLFPDDLENIEEQFVLFDALYNFYRIQTKESTKEVQTRKKTESDLLFS